MLDRGPGASADGSRLLLNGGSSQKQAPGQGPRPAESGGRQGRDRKHQPPHSPTSKRKKVQFTAIPPDDGCPTANCVLGGHGEDIKWLCRDLGLGAPGEPSNYLGKFTDKA